MRPAFSFVLVSLFAGVAAAVPLKLSNQGRLLDLADQPVEGTLSVDFALFDSEMAMSPVWNEQLMVTFTNGYYSVVLGETNAIDEMVLDRAELWLSMTVAGDELLPRHHVVSAPYAIMAGTAQNLAGGTVDATSIAIGGSPVVDGSGNWVGIPPPDTLSGLTCNTGDHVEFNMGNWLCVPTAHTHVAGDITSGTFPSGLIDAYQDLIDDARLDGVDNTDLLARWRGDQLYFGRFDDVTDSNFGCGTYIPVITCPLWGVPGSHNGPNCDDVPAGSFCESDGECGLSNNLNNCADGYSNFQDDWYFKVAN